MTAVGCNLLLLYGCLAHFHKPWGMKSAPVRARAGAFTLLNSPLLVKAPVTYRQAPRQQHLR
jgi:hypothetical protein